MNRKKEVTQLKVIKVFPLLNQSNKNQIGAAKQNRLNSYLKDSVRLSVCLNSLKLIIVLKACLMQFNISQL